MLEAINIASLSVTSRFWKRIFNSLSDRLNDGLLLSEALYEAKVFPNYFITAIAVGESTNSISNVLETLCGVLRVDIKERSQKLGVYVGSFFTVLTGVILIAVLYGLFYPIYSSPSIWGNINGG